MVEDWSGTVAQLRCNISQYDIVRTEGFPTLADISRVFGNTTSVQLLTKHLQSVMNYSGIDIANNQLAETAMAMLTNYYFLNVAEWCLFFNELKAGKRGQFVWGSRINNQSLMVALHDFAIDRRTALDRLEYDKRQQDAQIGFMKIESAASAIVQGIESVKQLRIKAKTDERQFRTLFPLLPDRYPAKLMFSAFSGDSNAIRQLFRKDVPPEIAEERLFRYLCEYNCQKKSESR